MSPDQEFRQLFNDRMNRIEEKIDKVQGEMTTLKVKVAIFGSIAGSIATIIIKAFTG